MLCNKLKEARESMGLTQKEVTDRLGISQAVYSYYEKGEKVPSVAVLKSLADLYNVSIDALLEHEVK